MTAQATYATTTVCWSDKANHKHSERIPPLKRRRFDERAQLFLGNAHELAFRGGVAEVLSISGEHHQILREVTISQIQPENGMRQCVILEEGDIVPLSAARVLHDTRCASRIERTQNNHDRHAHGGHVEVEMINKG